MADPKQPSGDKAAPPSFPAPRRQQEPSPYRKGAAPAGPDAPVSSKPMVVSRPEPPPPAVSPPKPPQPKVSPPPRRDIAAPEYDEPRMDPTFARLLARYPRGVAALSSLLFFGIIGQSAVHEYHAKVGDRITAPHYYFMFSLMGGASLWVLVTGIPIDDETGRPPDWWTLGLVASAVVSMGVRDFTKALFVVFFA